MSAFRKFYGRYNDLIQNYKLSLSYMLSDIFHTNSRPYMAYWLWQTAENSAFMIMELGSRRVWPIDWGCLLLLGTWSHLRQVWGSVLAHLFICLVIPTSVSKLITLRYHTDSEVACDTLTMVAENSAFMIKKLGSRWMWPFSKGCLLLLGTWSHL
jgi:hypothetical protein